MRLNINLATQPYQDVRRFLFRWGLAVAAVAALTALLVSAAIGTILSWRNTTRQANHYREEIAKCDREEANAKALLNRPENRATRDKSAFINGLIARKAFSWTEVLSDLEGILPSGIHIVGITPDITEKGELQLRLTAAGPSREKAIELISRMEGSPHFSNAMLRNDTVDQSSDSRTTGAPTYRFEISANYVPSYQRQATAQLTPELVKQQGGR